MIIDHTYFINELVIPNRDATATQELITGFIQKYEPDFLEKALGYSFYKEFSTGLGVVTPAQKWLDLRDGAEYTDSNARLQKWIGFKSGTGTDKKSVIANYVYYWYQRHAYTQNTSMGEVKTQVENAIAVTAGFKMQNAFNQIEGVVKNLHAFLRANKDTYTGWSESRYNHCMLHFKPINDLNV